MVDREKVIKGLECCVKQAENDIYCAQLDCPYDEKNNVLCWTKLNRDALELLNNSVSKLYADQLKWERDVALRQLSEIGKGFGERMDDIRELQILNGRGNVNG